VFPYHAAGTHPGYDYLTRSWGTWKSTRNVAIAPILPMGVSGVTIRTEDPAAGFYLKFNSYYEPHGSRLVRIFCECDSATFDLKLRYNNHLSAQEAIPVRCPQAGPGVIEVLLDEEVRYLQVDMHRRDTAQKFFQLYGISLETPSESGVLYHSVGINGAGFRDLLKQELMVPQLRLLQPDVVFLDLGGNEFFSSGLRAEEYESRLREVISRIRVALPSSTVVVGCSQDINRWRVYAVADCKPAAELARKVAFDMGCLFYDYYNVAGGYGSMNKWYAHNLAKPDRIHLSYAGYETKANLLVNAYMNTLQQVVAGYTQTPFLAENLPTPTFVQEAPATRYIAPPQQQTQTPVVVASGQEAIYVVQSGDVLGSIAQRYGVTVSQLQSWNGLGGTTIYPGQRLKVYGAANPQRSVPNNPPAQQNNAANTPNPTPPRTNPAPSNNNGSAGNNGGGSPFTLPAPTPRTPATHSVRSGDTLWGISQRYGVSIERLCQLNGISRNTTLDIGQVLKLR
jgi:LysM repeat protein